MPIYEYECTSCGSHFEFLEKVNEAPTKKCPKCGGELKRLISAPAFQFKGSGWYVTDYGRKQTGMNTNGNGGEKGENKSEAKGGKESEIKNKK